jgi:hypothetical protein
MRRSGTSPWARSLLLAALLVPWPHRGKAQAASVTARVTLDASGLVAMDVRDLAFGVVPVGTATTVNPRTSANAGEFEIHGTPNAEISVTVSLPAALRVGAFSMPVSFGAQGACYRNRDQQPACTYFNPAAPLVTRLRNKAFPDNALFVWVGGTVTPAAAQFPGIYRGTITLTAAYTGN